MSAEKSVTGTVCRCQRNVRAPKALCGLGEAWCRCEARGIWCSARHPAERASTIRNLSGQPISAGPEAIATNLEVPRGIAFGPGSKLYVTPGKAGNRELAQDRSSLGGNILRINPDGSVRPDNPDPASPMWSFGIAISKCWHGIRLGGYGSRSSARTAWMRST